jgi:polar amino acid transport system substrate-binding protein
MRLFIGALLCCASQFAVSQTNPSIPPISALDRASIQSFAPTGTLRVGINLGNPVLAEMDVQRQLPKGVTIDIANEIGNRTGLPVQLRTFQTAGATVDAIKAGNVDLVFVAIDPIRGADISYTPAYIQIEGAYMVKVNSPLTNNAQVDAPENQIVVGKGSAYDLYLTREIKQASLIRVASSQAVIDDFMSGTGNIAAGVKQQLEADAKRYSDLRMLPDRFMVINQAIGIPKARPNFEKTTAYLTQIINDLKSSGFILAAMQKHGITGAKVAQ